MMANYDYESCPDLSDVEVNGRIVSGLSHGVQPCQCYNTIAGLCFKRQSRMKLDCEGLKDGCTTSRYGIGSGIQD